ncbi:hypothetical protein QTP88_006976 [Uroleucon formosanum]
MYSKNIYNFNKFTKGIYLMIIIRSDAVFKLIVLPLVLQKKLERLMNQSQLSIALKNVNKGTNVLKGDNSIYLRLNTNYPNIQIKVKVKLRFIQLSLLDVDSSFNLNGSLILEKNYHNLIKTQNLFSNQHSESNIS